MIDKIISETLHRLLKEAFETENTNLNQYIPKKVFKIVDKLNDELEALKEMADSQFPELLDTSTGVESFFLK